MPRPSSATAAASASSAAAPTLATVAEEAGVSRQTVSNALNSPELLRPDTLARVQQAIEWLGYSPNRAARNLEAAESGKPRLVVERADVQPTTDLRDRLG